MIKIQVIGHLGKDCTVNNVNGKNVINFSVAHSEKYKDASKAELKLKSEVAEDRKLTGGGVKYNREDPKEQVNG